MSRFFKNLSRRHAVLLHRFCAACYGAGLLYCACNDSVSAKPLPHEKAEKLSKKSDKAERLKVSKRALNSANNPTPIPVETLSAKNISDSGMTNLGDYLQRIPSLGSDSTNNAQPGSSTTCESLRSLGKNETLVLLDGKRLAMDASSSCIDTNVIPVQLIQSVDLIKDGSEAQYGGDALAGVINLKLRHDLNGGNVTIRGGITGAGDGRTGMLSGYKGWNFDGGRGNLTLFGSYNAESGIKQKNRSWANPLYDERGGIVGSSRGPVPVIPNPDFEKPHGTLTDSPYLQGGRQSYQFARYQSLTNDLHTGNLYGDAHYDLNRHFTLYSNVLYGHKNAVYDAAPQSFSGVFKMSPDNGLSVGYIPVPQGTLIPQSDGASVPAPAGSRIVQERFTGLGVRRIENASDTYTSKFGSKGEIIDHWMYDASFTYGGSRTLQHSENQGDYGALMRIYGFNPENPQAPRAANCPNNPQGICLSPLTSANDLPAWANRAINATTNNHAVYSLRDWNASVHKNKVLKMPWNDGGWLGIKFGFEHRDEQLSQKFDPLITSGNSMTISTQNTSGGYRSNEGYLQGDATLLRNAPLAKEISVGGQGRIAGYSSVGTLKNWKAYTQWAPTNFMRFRGTLGQSFRQPSVTEMYAGNYVFYDSFTDPLATEENGLAQINNQVPVIRGGNPHLKAELGRTYTFGTILTPTRNLSVSVEYWHTRIKNQIGNLEASYIGAQCAQSGLLCDQIRRLSNGQVQSVTSLGQNLGGERTDGIDYDLSYSRKLPKNVTFVLSNDVQQLLSYQFQQIPGGEWSNWTGRLMYQGDPDHAGGFPRIRDYMTASLSYRGFRLAYGMQYMGGMRWNDGESDLELGDGVKRNKTAGIFSHDLTLDWHKDRWSSQVGIQNIANKKPPFVPSYANNTSSGVYGYLVRGRYFFVQAGANF